MGHVDDVDTINKKAVSSELAQTKQSEPKSEPQITETDGNPWLKIRFQEIYDLTYEDLWKYCLRRSVNAQEAEETLSETYVVAWSKLDQVPSGKEARPWLFAVARNLLSNKWRKAKRQKHLNEFLINEFVTNSASRDTADIATGSSSELVEAIGKLKEEEQELIKLACWDNVNHQEISAVLGCSVNAVGIRLHRVRGKLATQLGAAGRAESAI